MKSVTKILERITLQSKLTMIGVYDINEALQIAYVAATLGITTDDYKKLRNEKKLDFELKRKGDEKNKQTSNSNCLNKNQR